MTVALALHAGSASLWAHAAKSAEVALALRAAAATGISAASMRTFARVVRIRTVTAATTTRPIQDVMTGSAKSPTRAYGRPLRIAEVWSEMDQYSGFYSRFSIFTRSLLLTLAHLPHSRSLRV